MAKNPIGLLKLGAARSAKTAAVKTPSATETTAKREPLYRRLSERSAAETLDRWSAEGGAVTTPHLMKHVRALCKFRRHKEALEVMDWIGRKGLCMTSGSQAFCIDLLSKVRGIGSAETYFLSIPEPVKDQRIYGSLLYCYCRKRMKNEAVALYDKMKELNISADVFAYNNLMSLHMRLVEHGEIHSVFKEMKARGVSPDNCSYRILMKSYSSMKEVDSVERVVQEMEGCAVGLDWFTYCCLAEIYNSAGLFEKAEIALKKAELVMDGRDLSPFPLLLRLYAEARSLTGVKNVWKLLKARTARPRNEMYLAMLQALRRLDDVDAFERCFEEWELSCPCSDTSTGSTVKEIRSPREKVA